MFKNHAQTSMFTADQEYTDWVGANSFYGFLAQNGHRLFPDMAFESMYAADNGRPCASPCMLTKVLLLQIFDGCSDAEAVARASYDLRWKVALGVELESRPFAKSTLQAHRARLHLSGKFESLLAVTLDEARREGILKRTKIAVAVDTTPVLGRGAVKDTYNLVADGIKSLCRALSAGTNHSAKGWAFTHDFRRYWDSTSVKAMAEIDWSKVAQRQTFLQGLVADVDRILLMADNALEALKKQAGAGPAQSSQQKSIVDATALLRQLVDQDIDRTESTAKIREEVAKDRVPSVSDPEMRHGRKSASKRFNGHKLGIAVDTDSQLITAVEVHAGNSGDAASAMDLVKATESNTGLEVEKAIGDCAYGGGETRKEFADAERELIAKVPSPPKDAPCHKSQFDIDIENDKVTCPAGVTTTDFTWVNSASGTPVKRFDFPKEVCDQCPLRKVCFTEKSSRGRSVTLHEHESLIQAARKSQATPEFRQAIKDRQVVEHRLARMVQLGVRQARYFGRAKTRLQCTLAAVVANLTLMVGLFSHLLPCHTRVTGFGLWSVRLLESVRPQLHEGDSSPRQWCPRVIFLVGGLCPDS
jgi:hypothetical protein